MKPSFTLVSFILLLVSCTQESPFLQPNVPARYSITIRLTPGAGQANPGEVEKAFALLKKQASDYGIACQSIIEDKQQQQITFKVIGHLAKDGIKSISLEDAVRALSSSSALGFWETYLFRDVVGPLAEGLKQRQLIDRLVFNNDGGSSLVGYFLPQHLADLNPVLTSPEFLAAFPTDVVFAPSAEPVEVNGQSYYELHVLRKTGIAGPFLTGRDVANIEVSKGEAPGVGVINVQFKPEASAVFTEKTRLAAQNGNRELAITIDGNVASVPSVMSEITTGACTIDNHSSMEKVFAIANRLKLGALSLGLEVVEAKKL